MSQNTVMIIVVALVGLIGIILWLFKATSEKSDYTTERLNNMDTLLDTVKRRINDMLSESVVLTGDEDEIIQSQRRLADIERALTQCMFGIASSKAIVMELIKQILEETLPEINDILRVEDLTSPYLDPGIKFEILMYFYRRNHGTNALTKMIKEYDLDRGKYIIEDKTQVSYAITQEEINRIYMEKNYRMSYEEMIDTMAILVYRRYKGFGILDTLREMNIDGFNCGTSGAVMTHLRTRGNQTDWNAARSVWLYFEGKFIHLRFLSFGTKEELHRIISLMIRYNRPGALTEKRGIIVNTMEDQSRIMATIPPVAEYPAMFVRKFTLSNVTLEGLVLRPKDIPNIPETFFEEMSVKYKSKPEIVTKLREEYKLLKEVGKSAKIPTFHEVIMEGVNVPGMVKNGHLPIKMAQFLMYGQETTAVTGRQGSGKTTFLKALIPFIDPRYTLRVLEMAFELYLREMYPERNILTMQETEYVSATQVQDALKKSDGAVSLAGEVATDEVASRMIQFAQIASLFTLFTHHANKAPDLITGLRNHLMAAGGFSNTEVAERQILDVIHNDYHLDYNAEGYRYVDRISEIYPLDNKVEWVNIDPKNVNYSRALNELTYQKANTDKKTFDTKVLIRYNPDEHAYETVNMPSDDFINRLHSRMPRDKAKEFLEFIAKEWA